MLITSCLADYCSGSWLSSKYTKCVSYALCDPVAIVFVSSPVLQTFYEYMQQQSWACGERGGAAYFICEDKSLWNRISFFILNLVHKKRSYTRTYQLGLRRKLDVYYETRLTKGFSEVS